MANNHEYNDFKRELMRQTPNLVLVINRLKKFKRLLVANEILRARGEYLRLKFSTSGRVFIVFRNKLVEAPGMKNNTGWLCICETANAKKKLKDLVHYIRTGAVKHEKRLEEEVEELKAEEKRIKA